MKNDFVFLQAAFKEFIKCSKKGFRRVASGKRITKGVFRNYDYANDLLSGYETITGNAVKIGIINQPSTVALQREKKNCQQFFTGFLKFLYSKQLTDNNVSSILKTIKAVINFQKRDRGYNIPEFYKNFRVPTFNPVPVVLPLQPPK